MPAGAVSLIGLINPVVGTALGVAFAHEVFGTAQALGVLLVLGGVLLGQRVRRTEAATETTPLEPVPHVDERALTMSR